MALSLPLSMPHSKSSHGPRFSIPISSSTRRAASRAPAQIYLAEKAGKLIPSDFQGQTRVIQWCFAALSTVERPLMEIQLIDKFGTDEARTS